ncbi:MAG: 3-oxoacyl-[acyl-carrier-protein] synthase 3 [Acidimicrobiales bacterium]|nr:MAG: 3-oxoacyl-[acyl-carrier-protein] synthase 3 [Acidimicrobiales bacterium]
MRIVPLRPVRLVAAVAEHPAVRVTNRTIETLVDTADEWIVSHTGIRERRVSEPTMAVAELGARAVAKALAAVGWERNEIDLLVCSSSVADHLIPSVASGISGRLGVDVPAFTVNASCAGASYALAVATALAAQSSVKRICVSAAEKTSLMVDWTDRANCIFFGDSAAATLLEVESVGSGIELVDAELLGEGDGWDKMALPFGGKFRQDGRAALEFAVRGTVEVASRLLDRNGLSGEQVRAFLCHQANERLIATSAEKLGIEEAATDWHNYEWAGNQLSAGMLTALADGLERHRGELRDGDVILLTQVGGGWVAGGILGVWREGASRPA